MTFKVKKIRKKKSKFKIITWISQYFGPRQGLGLLAVCLLAGVLLIGAAFLKSVGNGGPARILPKISLVEEDQFGHTNILFLGVAGEAEEGGNLTDSMMLVSINSAKPSVSMLSLPRDLYIDSEIGSRKVNEIYAAARYKHGDERGLQIIERAISRFTNVEVHYSAVVNFQVFQDIVDELGGIRIFVPEDIVDPYYPDDNYGYQTFIIRKGIQNMDGDTALKYARSRKTSSDYSRAQRQQDVLFAIKQQAQEQNILFDSEKLKSIYDIYKKNVNTDISFKEMVVLAKIMSGIDYSNLVSAVLNDDPNQRGGFLYAPAREFYGGQFVLLPNNLRDTQKFIQLTLIQPEILLEKAQISVLNGSRITGLAGEMASRLRRFGFHVIETGNYESDEPVFRSFYQVSSPNSTTKTQDFIEEFLGFSRQSLPEGTVPDNEIIDLKIILGVTQSSL